jgi:tRNA_anti-like
VIPNFIIMTLKAVNTILIPIVLLIFSGISISLYLSNQGPLNVKNSPGIPETAIKLYRLYSGDSIMAKKYYTDKILEVSGEVSEVTLNMKQQKVVLLKTGISHGYVNCTLEEPEEVNIQPLDKINIKGICSGLGQGDPELGIIADVYLTRCFLEKD